MLEEDSSKFSDVQNGEIRDLLEVNAENTKELINAKLYIESIKDVQMDGSVIYEVLINKFQSTI